MALTGGGIPSLTGLTFVAEGTLRLSKTAGLATAGPIEVGEFGNVGTAVTAGTISDGGAGYTSAPAITFTGGHSPPRPPAAPPCRRRD